MWHSVFPSCSVDGPIMPAMPFSHMLSRGAVPNKCSDCQFLFEGECTRAMKSLGRFMALDHGTCRVSGSTDPVRFENQFLTSVVEIPRKCSNCALLQIDSIRGFTCGQDAHIWGNFPRELDWGSWHPRVFLRGTPAAEDDQAGAYRTALGTRPRGLFERVSTHQSRHSYERGPR